jgi:hypothetical protein
MHTHSPCVLPPFPRCSCPSTPPTHQPPNAVDLRHEWGDEVKQTCNWAAASCAVVAASPLIGKVAQLSYERTLGTLTGGLLGFLVRCVCWWGWVGGWVEEGVPFGQGAEPRGGRRFGRRSNTQWKPLQLFASACHRVQQDTCMSLCPHAHTPHPHSLAPTPHPPPHPTHRCMTLGCCSCQR